MVNMILQVSDIFWLARLTYIQIMNTKILVISTTPLYHFPKPLIIYLSFCYKNMHPLQPSRLRVVGITIGIHGKSPKVRMAMDIDYTCLVACLKGAMQT